MTTADIPELDLRAKLADIDRALAQSAQAHADADRKRQEHRYQPILAMIAGMTSGAALLAAGAALMKIFGG
jgi:hypothetical protein